MKFDFISQVISSLESNWKSKEIKISQIINTNKVIINVDPKYFYKCIFNIIHNAIKYSPVKGSVLIEVRSLNNSLEIEIKDEGTGFEEGFIIDDISTFATSEHMDGSPGLGLFLANQIINAHGGYIENGNNDDGGAFVKNFIPIE